MTDERPTPSQLRLAEQAITDGDWREGRALLHTIEPADLSEEERARLERLRALTGRDPAAVAVAIGLGLLLLAILALLYL